MRKGVRIAVWIGAAVVAVLVAGAGALAYTYRPISQAEADAAIQERLRKSVAENESVSAALFTTYSGKDERLRQYVAGTLAADSSEPARVDSQFHSASVGKTMLATVFGQLVDEDGGSSATRSRSSSRRPCSRAFSWSTGWTTPARSRSVSCSATPPVRRTTSRVPSSPGRP
ncbi:hypothetical protein Kisp01_21110 [Kineosporia sp. NBRC 101677]|nr:hypothetical protein Kisp01_21110 [Kineosporia sp. NBRC 101677]